MKIKDAFNRDSLDIPLMRALYYLAAPLSLALARAGMTPNAITSLSNLFAGAAVFTVFNGDQPVLFAALWLMGLLLDVSDGTVARFTGQSSANGAVYDHTSDKIKLLVLFLVVGLKYDEALVWIIAFLAAGFFLLLSVTNEELTHQTFRLAQMQKSAAASGVEAAAPGTGLLAGIKSEIRRHPRLKAWLQGTFNSLIVVHGHSMLFFLPIALGRDYAAVALGWFAFTCFVGFLRLLRAQLAVNRSLYLARNGG